MSWQALDTTNNLQNKHYESNIEKNDYSFDDDDIYKTDSSESDYGEFEQSGWGDNAKKEQVNWNTLVDPSVKIKAGDVGSGNLHRRGGNFKPVPEAAILAQRLNKGVPSKKSTKAIRPNQRHLSTAVKPSRPGASFTGRVNRSYVPPLRPIAPTRAPIRGPINNPSATSWGSGILTDSPFWDKKQEPPKPAAAAPVSVIPQQPSVSQLNQYDTLQNINSRSKPLEPKPANDNLFREGSSWGSAQKLEEYTFTFKSSPAKRTPSLVSEIIKSYNIPPTQTSTKVDEKLPGTSTLKWNIEAQVFDSSKGSNPVFKTEPAKWNAKVPSFIPSTASTSSSEQSSSTTSPLVYNADAPAFIPTFVPPPAVKKILKITSPSPQEEPAPLLPIRGNKSRVQLDQSLLRRHLDIKSFNSAGPTRPHRTEQPPPPAAATSPKEQHEALQQSQFQTKSSDHGQLESQTQPESTRGFEQPEPFLKINLEISEGISTTILVQEGSNPDDLAEEFGVTHRLKMTSKAKQNMASFITSLIEKKNNEKKLGVMD